MPQDTTTRPRRRSPLRAVGDRLRDREAFGSSWSWAKFCYHRLCGRLPLPFNRQPMLIRYAGQNPPVLLRAGTVDFTIWDHLFQRGEYDAAHVALPNAKTVLDLGANVGVSIRLWRHWWPGCTVVACEPDPANHRLANRNLELLHDTDNLHLFRAAAVARPRRVSMRRDGFDDSSFEIQDADTGEVDGLTVPQLLERAGVEGPIDLLKCDIEGAEEELFGDCHDWIDRVGAILIEVHGEYTQDRLEADLAAAGWRGAPSVLHDFDGGRVVLLVRDTGAGTHQPDA